MKVRFRIPYHTEWGECLYLTGSPARLGAWDIEKACPLQYSPGDEWKIELELDETELEFEYQYVLKNDRGTVLKEGGKRRTFSCKTKTGAAVIECQDWWQTASDPIEVFRSSAFTETIFKPPPKKKKARSGVSQKGVAVTFRVPAPRLAAGDSLLITGEHGELGSWDLSRAVPMGYSGNLLWEREIVFPKGPLNFQYKYIIRRAGGSGDLYEEGADRTLTAFRNEGLEKSGSYSVLRNDYPFRYTKPWRGAGVAVPVFSLRSKNSLGVGEFADLKLLIDWAKNSGLQIIQLLPINDTSAFGNWMDSYPYSPISVFALHPLYLNLEACGALKDASQKELIKKKKALNKLPSVDYEAVMRLKLRLAREIFAASKTRFLAGREFKKFYEDNLAWLAVYSLFCVFRDEFKTSDFHAWGKYARIKPAQVQKLLSPGSEFHEKAAFYWFLQYHLYRQLEAVSDHAKVQGVVLKGDIPIGLSKRSDSCWITPELFHLDRSAGAPPDPFSAEGQNWEFPTYNWDAMERDGYQWWKRRLAQMSRHFQAVRLDHVLGFFRIWEISNDSLSGLMGCFNPVLPLREEELEREGIRDLRRLTEPFITEEAVLTIFGRETGQVKSKYLNKEKGGLFSLKPAFQTQRKIEEHFAGLASLPVKERVSGERIKKGLRSLVTNVILLKDPAQRPGAYHFRINMNKTSSFLALSKKEQEILERLYVDYFYKRQEAFWDQKGRQKLPVLRSASNMLICGEDLGMVPDCVPVAMQELDLVSLRIQRMPKEFGREFGRPEDYPYLSVATTSSHDMPPLRAWWEEGRTRTVRFYKEAMKHAGDPPLSLEPWIAEEIILRHLESSSILAIFPIQDLLAMDLGLRRPGAPNEEQINDPSDPHHYWRFRLHLTLEELMVRKDFSDELAGLIKSSGRLSAY